MVVEAMAVAATAAGAREAEAREAAARGAAAREAAAREATSRLAPTHVDQHRVVSNLQKVGPQTLTPSSTLSDSHPLLIQVRGWTFTVGANTVGWRVSGPKHQLDVNIHGGVRRRKRNYGV